MSASEQLHRPKGPGGGQFTGTNHPEASDLELDGAARTTWDELNDAYSARDKTNGDIERLSARELADSIRERYPTAATLHLEDSDQGAHFSATRITDANGTVLHRIGEDPGYTDDGADIDTLASNFNNDTVSPLLTNHGIRRAPDYRLDLTAHGIAQEAARLASGSLARNPISRTEGVRLMAEHLATAKGTDTPAPEFSADWPLPHRALAELDANIVVDADHPDVQAGAVRDAVLSDHTVFQRRRQGVYPGEPYEMRFQTNRPISDDEMHQMACLVGYAYASKVRGEPLADPRRDSPYSFVLYTDTTKSRRDDLGQALEEFEGQLPEMIRDGSPVRTTDRTGPAGTRLVLGLNDPGLTFELYYDDVHESRD